MEGDRPSEIGSSCYCCSACGSKIEVIVFYFNYSKCFHSPRFVPYIIIYSKIILLTAYYITVIAGVPNVYISDVVTDHRYYYNNNNNSNNNGHNNNGHEICGNESGSSASMAARSPVAATRANSAACASASSPLGSASSPCQANNPGAVTSPYIGIS